jgi:hypothetical protein
MMRATLFTLALAAAGLARAQVALTVYNQDLAVVREERSFDLKSGLQSLRYTGVPSRIDATSVHLDGDGIRLLEQDYDFDLVSADKVLEKHIDQAIKASVKGGGSFEGTLLSFDAGQLVIRKAKDDSIAMLNRGELVDLDFPSLPGGLITRPTLVWKLDSDSAGKKPLTVTYMTAGISWHAEYVATLSEDEKSLGLNGWVSLDNQCGATFEDATLKLVAGDVHRAQGDAQAQALPGRLMAMAGARAAEDQFQERSFFDYHLYTLQHSVSIRQAQVKQVQLFSASRIPAKKSYLFDAERQGPKVSVTVELKNDEASGLGLPLPAGTVRVFKSDGSKGSEFVGEDAIDHTPRDEKLRLRMGNAFDVVGERSVTEEDPDEKDRTTERTVKIDLRNRKKEDVSVTVSEHAQGRWDIEESDLDYVKKNADSFEFEVPLKAGEEKSFHYRVRMRW